MVPLVWAPPVDTISILVLGPKRQIRALRWGPAGGATLTTPTVQDINFSVVRITRQASRHPSEVLHVTKFSLWYQKVKMKALGQYGNLKLLFFFNFGTVTMLNKMDFVVYAFEIIIQNCLSKMRSVDRTRSLGTLLE